MAQPGPSKQAPLYPIPLPLSEFAGVEYPGRVNSAHKALQSIGGLDKLSDNLLHAAIDQPILPEHAIELDLNAFSPFAHPVPASLTHTGNIVLKVTKRRRKKPLLDAEGRVKETGRFSVAVAGVATKTVRFRAMADFQHHYKGTDSIIKLTDSMRKLDVLGVTKFEFSEPNETFTQESFLPPPVFSRQIVPQMWDLKAVSASVKTTSTRANGEEVERYINASRWKGKLQQSISFDDAHVPQASTEPPTKDPRAMAVEAKLYELLAQRPMWTRVALVNQLDENDARYVMNAKQSIPAVSWTFNDGPFRDLCIRFGYDPRKHPEARFFQHVQLRNLANARSKAAVTSLPGGSAKSKPREFDGNSKLTHLFDGVNIYSSVGNFQLCDISDPLIKMLIDAPEGVEEECDVEINGWYEQHYYEQIKQVLRRKFIGIHQGRTVTDEDCFDLLGVPGEKNRVGRPIKVPSPEKRPTWQPQTAESSGRAESEAVEEEAVSEAGSREDSQGMQVDEDDDRDGGSSSATPAPASSPALTKPTRELRTRKPLPRASLPPWQARKRKNFGPKKPKDADEEMADRLRKAIGLAGKQAGADASSQAGDADDAME